MALPVTLYRWDDPGAPQLTNRTPADIIAVLKACLVDGYGDKLPAGWSVEFEDVATNQLVVRNNQVVGSGGFLHLYPYSDNNAGSDLAMVAAQNIPSLGTYTNKGQRYLIDTYYAQNIQWWVAATTRGFYFQIMDNRYASAVGSSNREPGVFVGDFESTLPNDAGQFIVAGNTTVDMTSASALSGFFYNDGTDYFAKIYDTDGSANFTTSYKLVSQGIMSRTVDLAGTPGDHGLQHWLQPSFFSTLSHALDNNSVSVIQSNTRPMLRGKFPGLLLSSFGGYSDKNWPVIEQFDGQDYVGIRNGFNVYKWLNLVEWYV
ncbi:hypothetical protein [Shewanella chilikensis]|uniref:hypothetical protein n=1 Tax=Shewanella chilikensis TaxID=558541 RepID=UPI0039997412